MSPWAQSTIYHVVALARETGVGPEFDLAAGRIAQGGEAAVAGPREFDFDVGRDG